VIQVLTPDDMRTMTVERRAAILAWIFEHDLDPMLVAELEIDGTVMKVHAYVRNPAGGDFVLDPATKRPKEFISTVSLKRALP
jgi:hypothetical protein